MQNLNANLFQVYIYICHKIKYCDILEVCIYGIMTYMRFLYGIIAYLRFLCGIVALYVIVRVVSSNLRSDLSNIRENITVYLQITNSNLVFVCLHIIHVYVYPSIFTIIINYRDIHYL